MATSVFGRLNGRRSLAAMFVVALVGSAGCDDAGDRTRGVNVVGPSSLVPGPAFFSPAFALHPGFIDPLFVADPLCPLRPPFLAPLSVVFRGDGRSGLFLSGVQMQFADRRGVLGGSMMFGRTDLVHRFGSTGLPAFGTRAFPFEFGFGCVGAGRPAGILTVVVLAGDSSGAEDRKTLRVSIR